MKTGYGIVLWLSIALMLPGCEEGSGGFGGGASRYSRRFGTPEILQSHGVILFPVIQNYAVSGKKKLSLSSGRGWFSSSSDSKREYSEDYGITNFLWREGRETGDAFRKMFPSDVLVVGYSHGEDPEGVFGLNDMRKLSFYLMEVVDRDTTGDGELDSDDDSHSLYIYHFRAEKLVKITPDGLSVERILYRGFLSRPNGFTLLKQLFFKEGEHPPVDDYVVLFEAGSGKKKSMYLYHVKKGKLENLSSLLSSGS